MTFLGGKNKPQNMFFCAYVFGFCWKPFFCCHLWSTYHLSSLQLRQICLPTLGCTGVSILIMEILIIDGIKWITDRVFSLCKFPICSRHGGGHGILLKFSLQGPVTNPLWRCSLFPASSGLGSSQWNAARFIRNPGLRSSASSCTYFTRNCLCIRSSKSAFDAGPRAQNKIRTWAIVRYALHGFNTGDVSSTTSLSCSERGKMFWSGDFSCKFNLLVDSHSFERKAFILENGSGRSSMNSSHYVVFIRRCFIRSQLQQETLEKSNERRYHFISSREKTSCRIIHSSSDDDDLSLRKLREQVSRTMRKILH